jgi:hypothetical protein
MPRRTAQTEPVRHGRATPNQPLTARVRVTRAVRGRSCDHPRSPHAPKQSKALHCRVHHHQLQWATTCPVIDVCQLHCPAAACDGMRLSCRSCRAVSERDVRACVSRYSQVYLRCRATPERAMIASPRSSSIIAASVSCALCSCANEGTHSTSPEQAFCSAPSIGIGGTDLPAQSASSCEFARVRAGRPSP